MATEEEISIMGDAYRFVKKFTKTVKGVLPKKNSKASPGKQLFYSPDYKVIYDEVLKGASLTLLNTAEMVLANYNYETIDSVNESEILIFQNNDDTFSISFNEYSPVIIGSSDPSTANMLYAINDATVSDLDNKLNNPASDVYSDILQYFGKYNSSNTFVKYLPKYDEDGKPSYDLEIPLVDISGVLGYNIYMIEEDDVA